MVDLRWGFLGASRIGRKSLAPAVHQTAGQVLWAVAARDLTRAREFARDLQVGRAYGSYQELLADPEVQAVYNALPNDAHLPLTLAALEQGKHVLCEKPLALSADEVRQIREAASRADRFVLEAFSYRFHPQWTRARELLTGGTLGELRFLRASFGFMLDRSGDIRWSPERGGGALNDVGCYCVDAFRLLSGREPQRVSAAHREAGGVDADFAGLLDFGEGLGAHFDCSFTTPREQHLTVVGTQGTLTLDLPFSSKDQRVTLTLNGPQGQREESFDPLDPYALMLEHFGQVVQGSQTPRFTLQGAEAQARALDALRLSAREARTIQP